MQRRGRRRRTVRQRAEQRDPSAGEGVGAVGDRFGDEQAGPRVAHRVLRVLGHEADEEQRVAVVVEPVAGDRSVRVARRFGGEMVESAPAVAEVTSVRQRSACDGSRGGVDAVSGQRGALGTRWYLVPGRSFGHRAQATCVGRAKHA